MRKIQLFNAGLTASAVAFIVLFQNCGDASFSSNANDAGSVGNLDVRKSVTDQFAGVETVTVSTQTDILFVVDESASMNVVLNPLRQGFLSLAASSYPSDTRMAVTNMAPAFYTNPVDRLFDVGRSFLDTPASTKFTKQPGFVRLVNEASIDSFLLESPATASKFPLKGCSSEWFSPVDKNSDEQSCLAAATQISLFGTGAEAGVISLDQLVRRYHLSGSRLFREGSLVNVVFVSDTHEPGMNYCGRPGAPASQFDYQSVVDEITAANPGILGVNFNGIVPLPPSGHPALVGVNTVGMLPADLEAAKISGENLYDFSYLPFVARSGGVAMHPIGNDWSTILPQALQEIVKQRAPVVRLSQPAAAITKVTANGVELPPSAFSLAGNRQDLQLMPQTGWPRLISVQVEYESD